MIQGKREPVMQVCKVGVLGVGLHRIPQSEAVQGRDIKTWSGTLLHTAH